VAIETETSTERKDFFNRLTGKGKSREFKMNFFDHIEDLRWHIIRSLVVWLTFSIFIFIYIDFVFDNIILAPANESFFTYGALCRLGHFLHLGKALCMPAVKIDFQIITVNGTFTSALDIAIIGGIILAFPYIFWELWRFIKPALSKKERGYGRSGIFWISFFFFCGALFGYFLLAPFTFNFLAGFSLGKSGTIQYRPSVNDYISSLTNLMLGCGIAFELPVFSFVLAKMGIVTGTMLKKYFKFALVIILTAAAVITPSPDWASQLFVALPLLFLYWISILIASKIQKERAKNSL